MWTVTYYNINTWDEQVSNFECKNECMEFANERLRIQSEVHYLSGKVRVFPPSSDVEIEKPTLDYKLAKMIAKCIDERTKLTVDDFYDSVNIPMEERTDFGFASLVEKANKYLDSWGY